MWEIATAKLLFSLPVALAGGALSTSAVAFSPDGKTLAAVGSAPSTSSELHVWDVASRRERFTLQGPFRGYWVQLAFSPDSSRIACAGGDPRVGLWDTASGKELAMYRGHTSDVSAAAFSPDGQHIAATATDYHHRGELVVRDIVSGGLMKLGRAQKSVAFSPDGTQLAAYSALLPCSAEVSLWDVATGRQLLVLKGHAGESAEDGIAFSPSGNQIVSTASLRGRSAIEVKTWDATPLPETRQP